MTWTPPQEFPELYGTVAIDLETCDPYLKTHGASWAFEGIGKVVGIAVSSDNFTGYFPIAHESGGNLPYNTVVEWAREQFRKDTPKVFANATYDLGWLNRLGITVNGELHDVQIAAPLLDEGRLSYSLDALGKDYLGRGKNTDGLKSAFMRTGLDPKKDMWRLHASDVGEYAEEDARLTYDLHNLLMSKIKSEPIRGGHQSLEPIYNLERSLIPVLIQMRKRGVKIDEEKAEILKKKWRAKEQDALLTIKKETGVDVNVWSANSLASVFDKLNIQYGRTALGAPSFPQTFLKTLDHPVGSLIYQARRSQKVYSTFIDGTVGKAVRGRVHCQFHPLRRDRDENNGSTMGTVSGRFSSTDPNLQQQPSPEKDKEVGVDIRSLFLPDEGEQWGALDYSAQEPRFTAHYAFVAQQKGADAAVNLYNEDPNTDFHQLVADICGIDRKPAKTINLGLAYGMGGGKLCEQLGLPTVERDYKGTKYLAAGEEGVRILELYNAKVPFVSGLANLCKRMASQEGYVVTVLGRKCRFYKGKDGKHQHTHKALNRLIQGSSADQIKKAMVDMHKAGINIKVTVHDEIGISFSDNKQLSLAKEIMLNAVQLTVPSKVDIDTGRSWGEASKFIGDI